MALIARVRPSRRAGKVSGDAHVHYCGADAFSFGEGISLQDGDLMVVAWEGFGRPLINPIQIIDEEDRFIAVKEM